MERLSDAPGTSQSAPSANCRAAGPIGSHAPGACRASASQSDRNKMGAAMLPTTGFKPKD